MAYLAVNKDGSEVMFKNKPYFDDRYGEWETELIPYVDEIKEKEPAVFYSKEGALEYINELSDKIGSEVVWESEN